MRLKTRLHGLAARYAGTAFGTAPSYAPALTWSPFFPGGVGDLPPNALYGTPAPGGTPSYYVPPLLVPTPPSGGTPSYYVPPSLPATPPSGGTPSYYVPPSLPPTPGYGDPLFVGPVLVVAPPTSVVGTGTQTTPGAYVAPTATGQGTMLRGGESGATSDLYGNLGFAYGTPSLVAANTQPGAYSPAAFNLGTAAMTPTNATSFGQSYAPNYAGPIDTVPPGWGTTDPSVNLIGGNVTLTGTPFGGVYGPTDQGGLGGDIYLGTAGGLVAPNISPSPANFGTLNTPGLWNFSGDLPPNAGTPARGPGGTPMVGTTPFPGYGGPAYAPTPSFAQTGLNAPIFSPSAANFGTLNTPSLDFPGDFRSATPFGPSAAGPPPKAFTPPVPHMPSPTQPRRPSSGSGGGASSGGGGGGQRPAPGGPRQTTGTAPLRSTTGAPGLPRLFATRPGQTPLPLGPSPSASPTYPLPASAAPSAAELFSPGVVVIGAALIALVLFTQHKK